ncbi:hypothetical protein WALSEDRAFT_60259 [Wallemia mellicola CBS 633.66]|uniref:Uncharacterized protein n=1 Tax=Wallemia mellicola (strain ATCC MYA-4683 / CBS 633.66) TaxID=671144 RepID=I4YCX3_WALMC|nr:hypothetical protein WALSEDRAFT_60259 [Wallemia mellicola CBS 633.66]EIM21815.1 hypothetical protein WALSEDRAFT_60259 [Wallemia mellicola CBS 633.66]|eukprot:XP_006958118.1 hypothetical protein WALSEDRAFT_60259 [Wallemia mellicola CBS 633.66]
MNNEVTRVARMERDLFKQFSAAVKSFESMLHVKTSHRVYLSYQDHLVHLLKLIAAYHRAGLLSNDFFVLMRESFIVVEEACYTRPDSPEHHKNFFKEFRTVIEEYRKMYKKHT